MIKYYKLSAIIYSILQFLYFVFIFLYTVGINPNRPNIQPVHFWIFSFVALNIFLLFYYLHLSKKQKYSKLKTNIAIACIPFLIITLGINFYIIWEIVFKDMDGGMYGVLISAGFSLFGLYLLWSILTSEFKNKTISN